MVVEALDLTNWSYPPLHRIKPDYLPFSRRSMTPVVLALPC